MNTLTKIATTLVAAALLVACQEKPEPKPVPEFPASFSAFIEPGGQYSFDIEPNLDWRVSIPMDATTSAYFRILDGSQQTYLVRGSAGEKATITILCIAQSQDFDDHTVEVSMTMDGQTQVIGTVTLSSRERTLSVYPALIQDGALVPAASGPLSYSYSETALSNDGTGAVDVVWDSSVSGYVGSVLVDANFAWTATSDEGLTMTTGTASGTTTEVALSCPYSAQDRTYTMSLGLSGSEWWYTYTVNVPAFVTEFTVYPPLTDEWGFVPDSEDSGYRMSYSTTPLQAGEDIELQWFEGTSGYMSYILVDANYAYADITDEAFEGKPSWLNVELLNTVGTVREYRLTVDEADYVLETVTDGLSFPMQGTAAVTNTVNITLPGMDGYLDASGIAYGASVRFDASGNYYNEMLGDYMEAPLTGTITSTEDIVLLPFYVSDGWLYAPETYSGTAWVTAEMEQGAAGTVLRTGTVSLSAATNSGSARQAVVYAFPQSVYDELLAAANASGRVLDEILCPNQNQYTNTDYILAYVEQLDPDGGSASGGSGAPVTFTLNNQSSWYQTTGSLSFEDITENSEDDTVQTYPEVIEGSNGRIYRLTYNSYISDPIMLDYVGSFSTVYINPWGTEWLATQDMSGIFALMPTDQASSSGNSANICFHNSDYNVIAVINVVCNY